MTSALRTYRIHSTPFAPVDDSSLGYRNWLFYDHDHPDMLETYLDDLYHLFLSFLIETMNKAVTTKQEKKYLTTIFDELLRVKGDIEKRGKIKTDINQS